MSDQAGAAPPSRKGAVKIVATVLGIGGAIFGTRAFLNKPFGPFTAYLIRA